MTLDIRGGLKNTKINPSPDVVFSELLANALDAYLIRVAEANPAPPFKVTFSLDFRDADLTGTEQVMSISCKDNGAGFGELERKAFSTIDTSYKDDLSIVGLGKSRGVGRIQFLHYFKQLKVASSYTTEGRTFKASVEIDEHTKEVDESSFAITEIDSGEPGTEVVLDSMREDVWRRYVPLSDLRDTFSASALKRTILFAFLHRLVGLKDRLGDFTINIRTKYDGKTKTTKLGSSDLPVVTKTRKVEIVLPAGSNYGPQQITLSVSHYSLDSPKYDLPKNLVALCAKQAPIQDVTKRYLKTGAIENNPISGKFHMVFVESDYFDGHLTEQRDRLTLPLEREANPLWERLLSLDEVFEAIDPIVADMLDAPKWDRDEIVSNVNSKFGVTAQMIAEARVHIQYGDTEETVTERVLRSYQKKAIEETAAIVSLKDELIESEPDDADFRKKVNDLAWRYTSALRNIDMAHLSQLVVRRAAIVEVLKLAVRKGLKVQTGSVGRRKDEQLIHSIFFPMGKDNRETEEHDIWLLSEEYQYFDYIASNKALSSVPWDGGVTLFESDIDAELQKVLERRSAEHGAKRPDIALFMKEGSAIIIEFKAPGVDLADHMGDLMEYSQLLAAKSKGRLKKFYGYLIGDSLSGLRMSSGTPFPTGKGWFGTQDIRDPVTRSTLGELYWETLFYDDVCAKADLRLKVYKDRLKLGF